MDENIFFYIGYAIPFVFVGGIIAVIGYYIAKRIKKRNKNTK